MCGIAGYYGKEEIPPERVDACLALMHRRGPDARGVYQAHHQSGQRVLLLHSRLAILDVDPRANQPFQQGNGVLVYNGEIYNYLEVREELRTHGLQFHTTCDTEVLAQGLSRLGPRLLDKLEGMWAFAWYDTRSGNLLLCRDRFGEKPLYLLTSDNGLFFASEVKFLAALAGRKLRINRRHIQRYLVNGYKSLYKTQETFFEDVRELPPSTRMTCTSSGELSEERYWQGQLRVRSDMSYSEAVDGAREALIRSVKIRLRSDVPLAFCMSGGVDSNSLISIAKRLFGYDVHGFTIANVDQRYEEMDLVNNAVQTLGIRHTAIPLSTCDFLSNLRTLIRYHDAPVYTITYYAHWLLMRAIAEAGYRVSLSGTGADELFSGYYDHHALYLHAVKDDSLLFSESLANWEKHIRPIVRNPVLQNPLVFIRNPHCREHVYLEAADFAGYLCQDFAEAFTEVDYCPDLLRMRMLNELFHEAVPVILHEDDLNAMFFSIENRSPFLSRELFDFCYAIPTRHLIRDGFNKKVLRDAMEGIVPKPVLDARRKIGFNAPIHSFLDPDDPQVVAELLRDSPVYDVFRRDKVEGLLLARELSNSRSKFLFNFVNVKLFLEEFA